jgi:hypothetical protein
MNTLDRLNKSWIVMIEGVGIFALPIGIFISFLLAFLDVIELPVGAGITLLFSFIFTMLHFFFLYQLVKCPSCGNNLSKFKNGKNIPMKQLYNCFRSGKPCRRCGWEPANET